MGHTLLALKLWISDLKPSVHCCNNNTHTIAQGWSMHDPNSLQRNAQHTHASRTFRAEHCKLWLLEVILGYERYGFFSAGCWPHAKLCFPGVVSLRHDGISWISRLGNWGMICTILSLTLKQTDIFNWCISAVGFPHSGIFHLSASLEGYFYTHTQGHWRQVRAIPRWMTPSVHPRWASLSSWVGQ